MRAVDLLPGNPSIVRSAVISVKGRAPPRHGDAGPERVLARWVPGHDAEPIERRRAPAAGRRANSWRASTTRRRGSSRAAAERPEHGRRLLRAGAGRAELLRCRSRRRRPRRGAINRSLLHPDARRGRPGVGDQPRSVPPKSAAGRSGAPDGSRSPLLRLAPRPLGAPLLVREAADADARHEGRSHRAPRRPPMCCRPRYSAAAPARTERRPSRPCASRSMSCRRAANPRHHKKRIGELLIS